MALHKCALIWFEQQSASGYKLVCFSRQPVTAIVYLIWPSWPGLDKVIRGRQRERERERERKRESGPADTVWWRAHLRSLRPAVRIIPLLEADHTATPNCRTLLPSPTNIIRHCFTVRASIANRLSSLIPRLHSDLLCRQHCLQWYNGSLITRYQWSVTDATLPVLPIQDIGTVVE